MTPDQIPGSGDEKYTKVPFPYSFRSVHPSFELTAWTMWHHCCTRSEQVWKTKAKSSLQVRRQVHIISAIVEITSDSVKFHVFYLLIEKLQTSIPDSAPGSRKITFTLGTIMYVVTLGMPTTTSTDLSSRRRWRVRPVLRGAKAHKQRIKLIHLTRRGPSFTEVFII